MAGLWSRLVGAVKNAPVPVAPAPAASAASGLPEPGQRWVTSTREAREVLKWIVTLIAGVAAVVFGAGPILNASRIEPAEWGALRYLGFLGGSVVGVVGVILVLGALLRAMLPTQLVLQDLPADLVKQIDDSQGIDLPSGASSVAELKLGLIAYRRAAIETKARAASAPEPEKAAWVRASVTSEASYGVYKAAVAELLERAGFQATVKTFDRSKPAIVAGGLMAVLGTCFFLLATSSTDSPAGPTLATLVRVEGDGPLAFWQSAGLSSCEQGQAGKISVLITAGAGTEADPYVVQTLSQPTGCPAVKFRVDEALASVVLPQPTTVRVEVSATPRRR